MCRYRFVNGIFTEPHTLFLSLVPVVGVCDCVHFECHVSWPDTRFDSPIDVKWFGCVSSIFHFGVHIHADELAVLCAECELVERGVDGGDVGFE